MNHTQHTKLSLRLRRNENTLRTIPENFRPTVKEFLKQFIGRSAKPTARVNKEWFLSFSVTNFGTKESSVTVICKLNYLLGPTRDGNT